MTSNQQCADKLTCSSTYRHIPVYHIFLLFSSIIFCFFRKFLYYFYFFVCAKQCTLCKLIRFFVIMISRMGGYFAERNLNLLSSFLHVSCLLTGEWCLRSPYTCHPFFHTFIVITDFYCRITILLCPFHCIHSA